MNKEAVFKIPKHLKPLFDDADRNKVIVAHRRWGKTSYGTKKIIIEALKKPNSRYFYVCPTYKQAKMIAWNMFMDYLRPLNITQKTSETELSIVSKTGSRIELKGADYPDSLRGVGIHGAILDEWQLQQTMIYTEILRPALADNQGWCDKLLTPKGKNHAYDDFVLSGMKHFYPASKTGILPQTELDEMKKEMSEDEYNQEMECHFLYFAGQIYKEFRRETHVIEPFEIPHSWERKIAVDYGLRNPTAVLFAAIDYDGNVFIYDEIYESGKEVNQHAENIKAKGCVEGVIDPSTNRNDRVKNGIPYSIYREFLDNGIQLTLAPNQVLGGINLVKQFLLDRRIKIFNRCENLIREMEEYRWKDHKGSEANLPEEPLKVFDHAVDALRYLLASRFMAAKRPPVPIKVNTEQYFEVLRETQTAILQPSWA